ncbi:MAG TPA: LON peptidase substrate-binding domain-containing protein [Nevskiaceae bacterium]
MSTQDAPQLVEMPLFPLSTVLFPGGYVPLNVFERRYVDMTRACLLHHTTFGVVLIKAGFETGRPAVPWDLGCTARIVDHREPRPDVFQLLGRGEARFRIHDHRAHPDGLLVGSVELLAPAPPMSAPDEYAWFAALLRRILGTLHTRLRTDEERFDDANWVACRIAERLPIIPERKQRLLAAEPGMPLLNALAAELHALDLGPDAGAPAAS